MAIKDRDGNVFKLRGPNPVMSTQDTWEGRKVVFHNMFFPLITMPDRRRISPMDMEEYEPIPTPVESEIVVDDHPELRPDMNRTTGHDRTQPDTNRTRKLTRLLEERKINLLCLPVKKENFNDNLYGTSYSRTQFGQKTTITGIVVSSDDLQFVFWTDAKLNEKSIVYPTQTEMKRWWRVERCDPQSGGFVVSCSPSPVSPDFSD